MYSKFLKPRKQCLNIVKRCYEPIKLQNLYKELDYSAPFSDEEKAKSLKLINEAGDLDAMQAIVPKKYSAKILNHKLQIGQFEVIEQLLDVKGIETNNLERILTRLSKPKKDPNEKQTKLWDKTLSGFTPRLSEQLTFPKTVVGLKFNLAALSYALFEDKQLVELKTFKTDFFESKSSFHTHNLLQNSETIARIIPSSDVIVNDTFMKIIPNDTLLSIKMNTNLLEASLFARLSCRKPMPNIYKFKYNLQASLFDLKKIGTERDKIHPQIKDEEKGILSRLKEGRKKLGFDENLCQENEVLRTFRERKDNDTEQQSEAFLTGLAFLHMLEYYVYKSQ